MEKKMVEIIRSERDKIKGFSECSIIRTNPSPFTSYLDGCGMECLKSFISGFADININDYEFETGMERMAFHVEQLHTHIPGKHDYYALDSTNYPVFHFSVLMHQLFIFIKNNLSGTEQNFHSTVFLNELVRFLQVPVELSDRVVDVTKKFTSLSRYMDLPDTMDQVMELLGEHPEDTFLLIQFYYLLRGYNADINGAETSYEVNTEDLIELILSVDEKILDLDGLLATS